MRWSILITLAVACLSFRPLPQLDILEYPITLNYQEATLRQILHDISTEYQIKFAYLNNEMPEEPSFSIQAKNQALRVVLDELLANTGLSYRVVNGQIVVKKKGELPPVLSDSATQSGEKRYQPAEADQPKETASTDSPTPNQGQKPTQGATATDNEFSTSAVNLPTPPFIETDSGQKEETAPAPIPTMLPPVASTTASGLLQETGVDTAPVQRPLGDTAPVDTAAVNLERSPSPKENQRKDNPPPKKLKVTGKKMSEKVRRIMDNLLPKPPTDSSNYLHSPFHLGFIYPLSTNGLQAGRTVNTLSFHVLAGYAAGLDGAEFSALGNIENNFVSGAQFAGFFNLVRRRVNGLQAAGFVNANGGDTRGAQLSGFVNVGAGTVDGLQAAGFVNVATGRQRGWQLSGFVNLLADSLRGVQGTGFVNVATGNVRGAQLSGFVNYTHHLRGLQATGFVNVASGDVRGVQIAGFINYAHHVKGTQIGLLNIADSIDGVPIGLLSIVRKNGYRRLEVWYGDALQANVAFKIGVPKFYSMLVVGTQFPDTDFRWGIGYGAGTLLPITSAFSMNIDLFAMQVRENNQALFESHALNLLNTLRLGFNLHLAKHFTLWAAPTFNVMVSEYQAPDSQTIGSTIAPSWTNYNRTFNGRTNVKMWPGFQVGLRF